MMERFLSKFDNDKKEVKSVKRLDKVKNILNKNIDLFTVLLIHGGQSFNQGLYRIHSIDSSSHWTQIIEATFPHHKFKIWIYGYDWLGRQFGVSLINSNEIFLFDVATNEVLKLPKKSIVDFHCYILS